jgi:hypothetical protein
MASQNSSIATAGGGGFGPALSQETFNLIGGAVSDIFGKSKAAATEQQGLKLQAGQYREAAAFAEENAKYALTSKQIAEYQVDRSNFQQLGTLEADIGGAGFANSGSAIYLMMDSAKQGDLARSVVTQQGVINIRGYEEQAKSYRNMATAAEMAAAQANKKKKSSLIGGIVKGVAAIAGIALAPATGGTSLLVSGAVGAGADSMFGE